MPPDPAPPPDAGRRPETPAGIPEPPKKTREINWTAVGSLAAVAAALIAFLAYVSRPAPQRQIPPRPGDRDKPWEARQHRLAAADPGRSLRA